MRREPLQVPEEASVRSPWNATHGAHAAVRRWLVVAPYIHSETGAWLHHFVDPKFGFQFETVPVRGVHAARRRRTNSLEWLTFAEQAHRAWRQAHAGAQPAGIVTLFPPLAALVALRKRLSGSKLPLVAWTFNVNALHGGVRGELARFALSAVDRFIVHSTAELASYEAWLKLPPVRAQFVPLQQVLRDIEFAEETRSPFVLAMGSANRDYATFARAMAIAGVRGVVVAEPHALEGVTFPPNVEVRTGLSHQACNALVQEARVLVVPVASESTASGQVALLTGMMYGRPVIATRCAGTEDYVRDGDDGMLVPRGDADAMAECLLTLWRSQTQREAIGARARTRIAEAHSDQAIGAVLASVLAGIPGQEKPTEARKEQ